MWVRAQGDPIPVRILVDYPGRVGVRRYAARITDLRPAELTDADFAPRIAASSKAGDLKSAPEDLRMSITNADASGAYPISGLTYILVYARQTDQAKGKALVDFLWWVTHDGQTLLPPNHYSPLPKEMVGKIEGLSGVLTDIAWID